MTEAGDGRAVELADEQKDLRVGELKTTESFLTLGGTAASVLEKLGIVTFYVDEQGFVRMAHPTRVYLDEALAHPPDGVEPRFVRPILSNGRPQFVAMKDGALWEVEFGPDEEQESSTGE